MLFIHLMIDPLVHWYQFHTQSIERYNLKFIGNLTLSHVPPKLLRMRHYSN